MLSKFCPFFVRLKNITLLSFGSYFLSTYQSSTRRFAVPVMAAVVVPEYFANFVMLLRCCFNCQRKRTRYIESLLMLS